MNEANAKNQNANCQNGFAHESTRCQHCYNNGRGFFQPDVLVFKDSLRNIKMVLNEQQGAVAVPFDANRFGDLAGAKKVRFANLSAYEINQLLIQIDYATEKLA